MWSIFEVFAINSGPWTRVEKYDSDTKTIRCNLVKTVKSHSNFFLEFYVAGGQ